MSVIRGLKDIAKALFVSSENTVISYARRNRDPLPLVQWGATVQIDARALVLWRRRDAAKDSRRADPDLDVVEGVIAIAACLPMASGGKCLPVKTVWRYARRKTDPLPVNGLGTRHPWIWRSALVDWCERQAIPWQVADKLRKNG